MTITDDRVQAGLDAVQRNTVASTSARAVLAFGPYSASLAAALRAREIGSSVAELPRGEDRGPARAFDLAVGVEPLRALEPSAQRALLITVLELLRPGALCVIHSSTSFASPEPSSEHYRDPCCAATHVVLASRVGFDPEGMDRRLVTGDPVHLPSGWSDVFDELERRTVAYDLVLRRPLVPPDTAELRDS